LFGASGVGGLNIYSMIVAVVGSVVVLLIYNAVVGRGAIEQDFGGRMQDGIPYWR